MGTYTSTLARILLASVFLGIVTLKIITIQSSPDGYEQYLALLGHIGLPGIFAPLLILLQLIGGLALLLGFKTKFFAYLLAIYTLFLAFILGRFQPDVFFLYLGLTGGLLILAANPASKLSVDNLKK